MMELKLNRNSSKILLTGFGPFPGVDVNASATLVQALSGAAHTQFRDAQIHSTVLPVDWRLTKTALREAYAHANPTIALHFGVAQNCSGFRIETRAANACSARPDELGLLPLSHALIDGGEPFRHATFPARKIVTRLTGLGLPATLSDDAGGYLCNAALYHALEPELAALTGFIHVPVDLSRPPLTFANAVNGGIEIIRVCLEAAALTGTALA